MTDAHAGLAGQLSRLPQRQVLSDDVYETVKGLIMDSVVEPGTRLNIDALTRELGISQTPIRESLARLESDGLVIKEPLRGYRVSSRLTRAEFEDLFEYRLLIEPWAAARAAERSGTDDLARLKAEMLSYTDVPDRPAYESYRAMAAHDQRFHDLVLELSGNETGRTSRPPGPGSVPCSTSNNSPGRHLWNCCASAWSARSARTCATPTAPFMT